ncbi:Threonine/homoserine efflux transporter RhtA [Bosea sp. CRIB-10]|uniref:DMT family transporter n=1 Tax=Bosea sp. CRIB-10 TaxID=378404 RepID=UPI0008E35CCC|nr:DMT family transporter [Bosea sp. CRIB-10]SFD51697.1 Threonine/homoserine efflux transporter RhtA [Bosea sp. CRIB-10]
MLPPGRWRRVTGIAWAALAVLILSGWFVVTRFGMTRELRIWDVAALRFGIGALLLAPILVRSRARLSPAVWGTGFVFAILWGLPFVLLVAFGLSLTSAALAGAITPALMPLFAGDFAWIFLGEVQGWRRCSGYAAILAGLSVLMLAGAATAGLPSVAGVAALVVAAAMWATYTLLFGRSGLTPIEAAALICFWSAVLFLPVYWLAGLGRLEQAAISELALQAVYQGVLMSGVAIFTFNSSVAMLGPAAATAIIALLPAVASLLGVPILGEQPSLAELAATAIIVGGVLLVARPQKPLESTHEGREVP